MGESAALLAIHLSGRMPPRQRRKRMAELAQALEQARGFVERIRTDPGAAGANRRHQAAVHSLDHLARLMNRMEQDRRIAVLSADHRLGRLAGLLRRELEYLVSSEDWRDRVARFDKLRSILRRQRRSYRATIIVATTHAAAPPEQALDKLDGLRWLHRVAYHIWRIVHHLEVAALPKETIADDEEPSEDPETDET